MNRADLNALSRLAEGLLGGHPLFAGAGHLLSRQGGSGDEFFEFQTYKPGDDIRNVDWRASARSGQTLTRCHREKASALWYILVDCSTSMRLSGKMGLDRWTLATNLATAFAALLLQSGHRVGLVLFDDDVRVHVPPRSGSLHLELLASHVVSHPEGHAKTGSSVLSAVKQLVRPTSCVVISDFLWPGGVSDGLKACAELGGETHVLRVASPADTDLPEGVPIISLRDSETSAQLSLMNSREAAILASREALHKLESELAQFCHSNGMVFSISGAHEDWKKCLIGHLKRTAVARA